MSWKNMQYKDGKMRTNEGGGGASNFADLDDVSFENLQNGQVPKYNSTTQKWENKEDSLANLSDTSMLTLSDKQVLSYNGRTQKWENKSNSVSRLSDVSLNSPSDGEILRYNAQDDVWENAPVPESYHIYSTSEQIVGEWIDGKNVYEKTFWLTSRIDVKNDYTTVLISNINTYNIKNIISAIGYDNNGGTDLQKVWYLAGGLDFLISNNKLIVYTQTNNMYKLVGYTLRYTKTTDV